jgi:hypothetical protein
MTAHLSGDAVEVIDDYLDALAQRVGLADRDGRRTVSEAADHLIESTSARVAAGQDPVAAATRSVYEFGDPAAIARAERRGLGASPSVALRQLVDLTLRIGIVAAFAIGLSGVLAWLVGRVAGMSYVVGDILGVTYTPTRCAEYTANYPTSANCEQAAVMDHFDEVVFGRILVLLLGWLAWRRSPSYRSASESLVGIVGAGMALVAAAALLLTAVNGLLIAGGVGTGAPLSAALCFLVAAVLFARPVVRAVRRGRLPTTR